jgi:hypothetical protein
LNIEISPVTWLIGTITMLAIVTTRVGSASTMVAPKACSTETGKAAACAAVGGCVVEPLVGDDAVSAGSSPQAVANSESMSVATSETVRRRSGAREPPKVRGLNPPNICAVDVFSQLHLKW